MSRPDITAKIGANAKDFHSAMDNVRKSVRKTVKDAATASTATAALVVGVYKKVSDSVLQLAADARTAGTTFEEFQELKFYMDQNLVSTEALTDGLKEMQLRLDEALDTGGGPAIEALQTLGYDADQLGEKLKNPSALFEEIIDRVKTLDRASQIRVLDEIFGGTAAEQFQRIMNDANGAISEARKQAHDLGIVLEDDYLDVVERVNEQWNFMASYIGNNVRRVVIDLTNDVIGLINRFRQIENLSVSQLQKRANDVAGDIKAAEGAMRRYKSVSDAAAGTFIAKGFDNQIANSKEQLTRLRVEQEDLFNAIEERNANLKVVVPVEFKPTGADAFPSSSGGSSSSSSGGSRKASVAAAKEERDLLAEVIKALKEELELVGLSEVEREKVIQLRRANVSAASEEGAVVSKLVETIAREEAAHEAANEQRERAVESQQRLADQTTDWLESAIDGTLEWSDVLKTVLAELKRAASGEANIFSGLLGGGGGFFSGLGRLFGLNFEGGGQTPRGARAGGLDGKGGMLAMVHPNERWIDETKPFNDLSQKSPVSSGGNVVQQNFSFGTINGEGHLKEIARQAAAEGIRQVSPKIVSQSVGAVGEKMARSPGFGR